MTLTSLYSFNAIMTEGRCNWWHVQSKFQAGAIELNMKLTQCNNEQGHVATARVAKPQKWLYKVHVALPFPIIKFSQATVMVWEKISNHMDNHTMLLILLSKLITVGFPRSCTGF